MVQFFNVMGLTPQDFQKFTKDFTANSMAMPGPKRGSYKLRNLEKVEGRQIVWLRLDPSIPFMSPRTEIIAYYEIDNGESNTFIMSSRGNENLLDKYRSQIDSGDVIGTLEITYMDFQPIKDQQGKIIGTRITNVGCNKANGYVIGAMERLIPRWLSDPIFSISEWI